MFPTTGHSGKGKTMVIGNRSVVARDCGKGRGEQVEHQGLGQCNYSVMVDTSHFIFVKIHRRHSTDRTLMETVGH